MTQPTRQPRRSTAPFLVMGLTIGAVVGGSGAAGANPASAPIPRPARTSQEPGYRDGQRIGGGGAAEPASTAGTVTFFVSSAAVVGVIVGGIVIGGRRKRRRPDAGAASGTASTQNDQESQEPEAP